jgi:broad specificity phosphatase PhoE
MKSLFTVFFVVAFTVPSFGQKMQDKKTTKSSTTTYYFIRHAEKDRSDDTNKDPELTEDGLHRAKRWSEVLQNITFDAVYSTDYNRTKQTATPTAKQNELDLSFYDPSALYSDEFAKATKGKTVLVVGHSNTTPAFVNMILKEKKYEAIDDTDNSKLFIVTISKKNIIDQVLTIN